MSGTVLFGFSPNGSCEKLVVDLINQTQSTLLIADYSFTNQPIADAIDAAFNRGVKVRIVFDESETHSKQGQFYDHFETEGIPIRICKPPGGIMHDKYLISDGEIVENGSFNYTEAAQHRNRENVQIHSDPDLASVYTSNFEDIWSNSHSEVQLDMRQQIRSLRATVRPEF